MNVGAARSFDHTIQVPIDALRRHYTHIVLAYGASIPFILPALGAFAMPALSIVHWYTGHPSNPTPPPLESIEHMTLIGHGNVSLDIARLLLSSSKRLAHLDIPQKVLDVMDSSKLEHISIVSRRGPAQVAFTARELRELLNLPDASMVPIPPELLSTPLEASRQQARILDLLRKGSAAKPGTTRKTWSLEFFRSPTMPVSGGIELGINELDKDERAVATGKSQVLHTDLVVNSVGYRSEPMEPGWFDGSLGRTRQSASRVIGPDNKVVPRIYASGWAANGAKGVLATTMMDAYSVAEKLVEDSLSSSVEPVEYVSGIPEEITRSTQRVVTYGDWKRIDAEEVRRGEMRGKERERMMWAEANEFLG